MHAVDGFILASLIVLPIVGGPRSWRSLQAAVARGEANARVATYRHTVALQWASSAAILSWWSFEGRPFAELGVSLGPRNQPLWPWVATALALAFLAAQVRKVLRGDARTLEPVRASLEDLSSLMPSTPRELAWFIALALSAGCCEELAYRGYLPWCIGHFVPRAWAALLALLVFGAAHAYQGLQGALKCTLVGGLAMLLFWFSGSLVLPALLHAAIDVQGGLVGWRFQRLRAEASPAAPRSSAT